MEPIKANIGTSDNLANLKNWQDMFGELAKGYIDPAEPRKLAPGQSWGAGIGKLVHKYAFDMPASIVVNAAKLFDKGSKDPLSVAPLEYTASVADALLTATPGGGTGVANIGKRDALRNLGRSGVKLSRYLRDKDLDKYAELLKIKDDFSLDFSSVVKLTDREHRDRLRKVATSVRSANTLPQKEFDRIDDFTWGMSTGAEYGSYSPGTKKITLTDTLLSDSAKEVADTVFHEPTHARQYNPDKSLSEMVKARALRKASEDMPYRIRPVEQLARETARSVVEDGFSFEEAYRKNLDLYLRTAKANKNADVASSWEPYQGQWSKLAPHLREGLELAKKVPLAKKKVSNLSKIAAKASEIENKLRGIPSAKYGKEYGLSKPFKAFPEDPSMTAFRVVKDPNYPNRVLIEGRVDKGATKGWEPVSSASDLSEAARFMLRMTDRMPDVFSLPEKKYDAIFKAANLQKTANQQQVEYHRILQEFGIE